jgi:hypothetical protein
MNILFGFTAILFFIYVYYRVLIIFKMGKNIITISIGIPYISFKEIKIDNQSIYATLIIVGFFLLLTTVITLNINWYILVIAFFISSLMAAFTKKEHVISVDINKFSPLMKIRWHQKGKALRIIDLTILTTMIFLSFVILIVN